MKITRRTALRGLGTVVALPLLEGMLPLSALAQTPKAVPKRLAFLFVPNGVNMAHWKPGAVGAAFELPTILEPLAGVKDQMTVLTGLAQHGAFALGDGPGDHARSAAAWLTGVHPKKTSGADIHVGISVDQLAAQKVGGLTRFPSLELGCERGASVGDCDSGYSCAYSSSISWRSETTPVAKEINPRLVFERLFGGGDPSEADEGRRRRERYRLSVLDFVLEEAGRLKQQMGVRDLHKMDEYFESVREIERRIQRVEAESGIPSGAARPMGVPRDYGEHLRLMGDMMVLAFQADLTRVSTFMFANEGSNRSYAAIGVPEGHHEVSHHGQDPGKLEKKRLIDRFHVEQLAYVLDRLRKVEEPNGTLLDNTMLVYGGGISDGDRHNHDDLPILLFGKGGGTLRPGRHVAYETNTPMNNLFVSLLDRMGVPGETLGDATGKLDQLF